MLTGSHWCLTRWAPPSLDLLTPLWYESLCESNRIAIWTRAKSVLGWPWGSNGVPRGHLRSLHPVTPGLGRIIARRRPLRAQYERTPRHWKRELLGCITRTTLSRLSKYNEIIYITRNSNRLKPSGGHWSCVNQKANGLLARCPITEFSVSRRAQTWSVGWRVANSRPLSSSDLSSSLATLSPMFYSRSHNLVTGLFSYTGLHFYTPTLSPSQLEVSDPLVESPCTPGSTVATLLIQLPPGYQINFKHSSKSWC